MLERFSECTMTMPKMSKLARCDRSTILKYIQQQKFQSIIDAKGPGVKRPFDIKTARKILSNFVADRHPIYPGSKVMSFYNFKGGTGKTTVCYQYATNLSLCGYNVLLIDADPQGHLSSSFGFDTNSSYSTLYDVIVNKLSIKEASVEVWDGLDCIPANLSLTKLESKLNEMTRREDRFSLDFRPDTKYDFIIFDTNPTISMVNRNISTFSDIMHIVTETQPYSLHGLRMLMGDLEDFFASMDRKLPLIKIIANKYEERTNSSAEAITSLYKMYGDKVLPDFAIRRLEEFVKASKLGMPLAFFAKAKSPALEDVVELIHLSLDYLTKSYDEEKRVING